MFACESQCYGWWKMVYVCQEKMKEKQWQQQKDKPVPTRKTSASSTDIRALCLVQYVYGYHDKQAGHKSTITEDAYCQQLERVIEALRPTFISIVDRKCYSSAWNTKDAHCKTNGTKDILWLLLAHAQYYLDSATTDFICFNRYKIYMICSSYGNCEDERYWRSIHRKCF